MKLTLSWLKEHLETEAGIDEIVETLTAIGLEVESVENAAAKLAPFTIARICTGEVWVRRSILSSSPGRGWR